MTTSWWHGALMANSSARATPLRANGCRGRRLPTIPPARGRALKNHGQAHARQSRHAASGRARISKTRAHGFSCVVSEGVGSRLAGIRQHYLRGGAARAGGRAPAFAYHRKVCPHPPTTAPLPTCHRTLRRTRTCLSQAILTHARKISTRLHAARGAVGHFAYARTLARIQTNI